MVQPWMIENFEDRAGSARLGVERADDQASQPGVNHGSGAHGARFERDVEMAIGEPVVAERAGRLAQGDDLGVSRGIDVSQYTILPRGNDLILEDDDSANRHLSRIRGECRLFKCTAKVALVVRIFHLVRIRYRAAHAAI